MTNTHGGKRQGAGRKPGIPNKSTEEIREIAKEYAPRAIEKLYDLMENSENVRIQFMACKEILDRGYGRCITSLPPEPEYQYDAERAEKVRQKLIERFGEN